jgi:K(+)-stimulated pyrophosphate-energized sodium pump
MSVVALVIAPSIAMTSDGLASYNSENDTIENVEIVKEVKVEMNKNDDGTVKAVVTMVITENGEESTTYETFEGSEAEVKSNIDALKDKNMHLKTGV